MDAGTGCVGFLLEYLGTCTINIEDNATEPITDVSDLVELQLYTLYTHDATDIVDAAETECNTNDAAVTFDDYLETEDRPEVLAVGEGPLCCRGTSACSGASITTVDGAVSCEYASCSSGTITTQSNVLCIGTFACSGSSISTSETLILV